MTMRSKPCPTPELLALLKNAAAFRPMTAAELNAQRRSWVVGNMLIDFPEMTRAYAERLFDEAVG